MLVSANVFQPLIDVFQHVIVFFHNSVGISWGWSIVLLTVCVRLVMVPLFFKQFQSMRAMQQHMPEMNAIKQKYKDDKARQQEEMMKFYRENHVNPFASCLPMALQLPIFISLYYMLRDNLRHDICPTVQTRFQAEYVAHQVKAGVAHAQAVASAHSQTTECLHYGPKPYIHASFLFIHDITASATGLTLVVLLVLYVSSMLGSTLVMAQPTMDANQRRMMMFMPIIFVPFIVRFPSGLLVYWITTNMWQVGQQFVMRRRIGPPQPAVVAANGDGTAASGSGSGTGSGGGSFLSRLREQAAAATSGGTASGNGSRDKQAAKVSGSGARGASAGDGHTNGETRSGGGSAPPPPPRKKKKRSGRRR